MQNGAVKVGCFLLVVSASLVFAEPPASPSEALLPRQMQMVNGVLVPVPAEIFRVLDIFRDSNWSAVQRRNLTSLPPAGSSARVALSLGLVIGEGFIAVAAKDPTEMQGLGKEAIKLARALGVEKSVIRREKSIIDHAERKEWGAVRLEWSNATADLKAAMVEIKSEPTSQLISLGGWLRGIEALSALVTQRYSPDNAQLLRQPAVLDYFGHRLSTLSGRIKADPLVAKMQKGVIQLQPVIGNANRSPLSERDVRKIHKIAASLVQAVCTPAEADHPR